MAAIERRFLSAQISRPAVLRSADLGECEKRCVSHKPCPICAARKSGSPVISGLAAVWNSESRDVGGFVETIAPGSFADVIARSAQGTGDNIAALYNHDKNIVLGRHQSGTMKLVEDSHGLRYTVAPPKHNWWVAELVERGDVNGSSFSFANARQHEQWSPRSSTSGLPRRHLVGFTRVIDVGPVLFPAFGGTEGHVSARALDIARSLSTRTVVAVPRAIEFLSWARERGLSSRSVGSCGQENNGRFGLGNTCAKGGKGGQVSVSDAPPSAARLPSPSEVASRESLEAYAAKHDHGSHYSEELDAVVPNDLAPIADRHAANAAAIDAALGVSDAMIPDDWHSEDFYASGNLPGGNTATTIDELIADAAAAAPAFREMMRSAATSASGAVAFGPGEGLKSRESLISKRNRQGEWHSRMAKSAGSAYTPTNSAMAVASINDAVRGTIIADSVAELRTAIQTFRRSVEASGGAVGIDNKWDTPRAMAGYVGVHANVMLRTPSGRRVMSEVQFHLRSVFDGSMECPKERSERMYKKVRDGASPGVQQEATAAMHLIFAAAAENAKVVSRLEPAQ